VFLATSSRLTAILKESWSMRRPGNDYRIAPFHILATEGKVWHNETHLEHLSVIQRYMTGDPIFIATEHLVVDPSDERSVATGIFLKFLFSYSANFKIGNSVFVYRLKRIALVLRHS
jgi:hypothetical protein